MNANRRKRIDALIESLELIKSEVEEIAGEERDAFDNLSENIQNSERGRVMESAADSLDEAVEAVETAFEALQSAKGQ